MSYTKTKFKPYQILFLFMLCSCNFNPAQDFNSYPIPSYNNYYQTPPVNNYRQNQRYNNYNPAPPARYYDYDNSYTAPYGQNYNQIDNYAPQQQPYNYQRPYQPDPYYNMNQYNQNNGYNAYPQDNDASYYYNYTPNSNNSDADSYDVSR
ncbi:MAG: hypothetical protein HON42_05440 [Alphaproteobacteria bacterium]|jgi:hypothetical protein|nr:hypothetical protein [Alphaproteobacteria bacterium]MBT5828180.1 hypothetical protein [Alphaproteobacteria bacterium]